MGATRRHLTRPELPDGARKDLSDALHDLLRRAGRPSTRDIAAALKSVVDPPPSHTRIHDLFTHRRLPDWQLTMCVVEVLACRARGLDVSAECDRFDHLWSLADEELVLDPPFGKSTPSVPEEELAKPASSGYADPSAPSFLRATPQHTVLPDADRCRAVFFGVGAYSHLEPLPSAPTSVQDLAATLAGPLGAFTAEHSQVLLDPRSASEVLDRVSDAGAEASDTLLLHFSGHGLIDSNGDLALALPDSRANAAYTSLPYAWIRDEILHSRAKRKVVILDCCFSGRAAEAMAGTAPLPLAGIEGTVLLASASSTSVALAPAGQRHTAFTGELINILRQGIPNGPEVLDVRLIFEELRHRSALKRLPLPHLQARETVINLPLAFNAAKRV